MTVTAAEESINPYPFAQTPERAPLVPSPPSTARTWCARLVTPLKKVAFATGATALTSLIPGSIVMASVGPASLIVASATGLVTGSSAVLAGKSVKVLVDKYEGNHRLLQKALGFAGGYALGWGVINECSLMVGGTLMPLVAQLGLPFITAFAGGIVAECSTENWGTFVTVSAGTASLTSLGMSVWLGTAFPSVGVDAAAVLGLASTALATCSSIVAESLRS